jgi:hypothetical protein
MAGGAAATGSLREICEKQLTTSVRGSSTCLVQGAHSNRSRHFTCVELSPLPRSTRPFTGT